MTAALEGGEWSAARPGRTLPPGKNQYQFYRRLSGPQGRSERAENLVPTGIRSLTFQPIVSHYTDWATEPTQSISIHLNSNLMLCPSSYSVSQTAAFQIIFPQMFRMYLRHFRSQVSDRRVPYGNFKLSVFIFQRISPIPRLLRHDNFEN